jgi:AcrR family transcriptional regulator
MPLTRAQQKEQTRRKLIDAALAMVASGETLDGLSLREVARLAGIAPTSFYSHFADTGALAVVLIDEACLTLRQLMRQGRREMIAEDNNFAIRQSVLRFVNYLDQNAGLLRLLVRERFGGNEVFRRTIQRELRYVIDELAEDIDRVIEEQRRQGVDTRMVAEMATLLLFEFGAAALDMSRTDREIAAERLVRKLTLVFLGGRALATNRTL